jgi:hypothetical protein
MQLTKAGLVVPTRPALMFTFLSILFSLFFASSKIKSYCFLYSVVLPSTPLEVALTGLQFKAVNLTGFSLWQP